jgi:thymidylate kinase
VAESIPRPDISFFLDVSVDAAIQRIRQRINEKDKWIDIELQHKLREEYLNISNSCNGYTISTAEKPEITFEQIWDIVDNKLNQKLSLHNNEIYSKILR